MEIEKEMEQIHEDKLNTYEIRIDRGLPDL